jgi:hypothetical protein
VKFGAMESKVRYGAEDGLSRLNKAFARWTSRGPAVLSAVLIRSVGSDQHWHSLLGPKLCVECTVQPPVIYVECKQRSVRARRASANAAE